MTQLEDYVQQREKLNELIAASRAVLNSNASETDKRLAKRRITQYGNLRKELNEQIALLSPESVKKRKSTGRHNVHIHLDDTLDGTKPYQDRFAGVYSTADGHTRTRYSGGAFVDAVAEAADDEISQEMLQRRKWMKEAVSAMTARQAEVVDLHYNKGYSLRKIAEISGVRPQSISEINVAAMDIMGYWCKARAAVSECKWPNGTFDFELFFEKIPNAFPYRCKVVLLRLADAEDDGYPTIAAFCRDNYDISESKIRYALAQIKMYCKGYGIPMSGVPYLIRRAKDVPFDQSSFIRACYSFSKRGDKGYSSLENNTIPIVTGKSPYHEYGSFDNAVFERLTIMGFKEKTSDIDRWIEEAITLLSDKNREMAFRVINDKRSTKYVPSGCRWNKNV